MPIGIRDFRFLQTKTEQLTRSIMVSRKRTRHSGGGVGGLPPPLGMPLPPPPPTLPLPPPPPTLPLPPPPPPPAMGARRENLPPPNREGIERALEGIAKRAKICRSRYNGLKEDKKDTTTRTMALVGAYLTLFVLSLADATKVRGASVIVGAAPILQQRC